jgi:hypothetical protein
MWKKIGLENKLCFFKFKNIFRMFSKIHLLALCLLWALVDVTLTTEVNNEAVVKHVIAEVQKVLEEEKAQLAKARIDFNSIPGHARFINSER